MIANLSPLGGFAGRYEEEEGEEEEGTWVASSLRALGNGEPRLLVMRRLPMSSLLPSLFTMTSCTGRGA